MALSKPPCQDVKAASCFWVKGAKVGMSRFVGAIYKFRHEEDKLWHTRLVALLYWAILAGKFTKAKLNKLDTAAAACRVRVSEAEEAMPLPQGNNELKQLRTVCDNGLHMAVVVYSNMENLFRMRIIDTMTVPISEWHSEQNKRLRTVEGASSWMIEQCAGAFFDTLVRSLSLLSNPVALEQMGFALRLNAFARGLPIEHPAVAAANELATLAACFVLTLVGCRLRRCLWLISGWPAHFCLLSSGEAAVRTGAVDKLKADYHNFEWLKAAGGRSSVQMLRRSCFQTTSVQQLIEVMKSTDWVVTDEVKAFSLDLSRVILSSQIVEDGFNRERRSEAGGNSKAMSNTRVHSVLIENSFWTRFITIHRWTTPPCLCPEDVLCQSMLTRGSRRTRAWTSNPSWDTTQHRSGTLQVHQTHPRSLLIWLCCRSVRSKATWTCWTHAG